MQSCYHELLKVLLASLLSNQHGRSACIGWENWGVAYDVILQEACFYKSTSLGILSNPNQCDPAKVAERGVAVFADSERKFGAFCLL